ncbi:MAG TPA: hypothetical protein DCE42_08275 [Myxococcales bacterium]|nr:hypothetical protein [Deltaproteobacteria bacterium]MBU48059.1 hypothetical protein [Deltaproteobacteria bacterium]HAA54741.1 hypothetical protein [Myxococcales bacterium]
MACDQEETAPLTKSMCDDDVACCPLVRIQGCEHDFCHVQRELVLSAWSVHVTGKEANRRE